MRIHHANKRNKTTTLLTSCTNSRRGVVGARTLIATTWFLHVPLNTSEKKPMPIFSSRSTSYRVIVQLGNVTSAPLSRRSASIPVSINSLSSVSRGAREDLPDELTTELDVVLLLPVLCTVAERVSLEGSDWTICGAPITSAATTLGGTRTVSSKVSRSTSFFKRALERLESLKHLVATNLEDADHLCVTVPLWRGANKLV